MKKRFIILLITAFFYIHLLQAQILNNNFEKIDIYYADFSIMTAVNIPCHDFIAFSDEHKTITDSLDIEIWIGILNRLKKTDTVNESCKDKLDTRAKLFLYGDNKNIMICIDNWNTDICNQCYNTSSELKQALEKTFQKPKPYKHKKNNRK
ncbi:hypothetical protein OCV73_09330 [Barnesiella propionica]|uniref:hypothetical protein n=1 Tax=Barnesiella propionica TaxID=2981781 RepID=UPI0011CA45B9|nr:hypothetical protein [Barnesiella propionica]MCU6769140.1 hypothetical protein [Barnesiella propionica]